MVGISDLDLSKEAFHALCVVSKLHTNEVHRYLVTQILFDNVEFIKAVGKRINIYHTQFLDRKELFISLDIANMCYRISNKALTSRYLST